MRNIPKQPKNSERIQKSFYVSATMNKALKFMAADENKSENEILNEALQMYVPKKYLDMVVD